MLCRRAWRLAGAAKHILPPEELTASPGRRAWGRGLLALSGVYALLLLGVVGTARYQESASLLQSGVDLRREQQAALALDEGVALFNQGELRPSEQALQRSLRLWEELAAGRSAPPVYRQNLAITLNDLGLVCQRQKRLDEAEAYYARAVALADGLAGGPGRDSQFTQTIAKARAAEEILPQATNESYRRDAVARLAEAYLVLGDFQQQLGKRAEAEASLRKAIDYGEKAAAQEPDRPLARHQLELARRKLEGLREQALQEETDRLCAARHFRRAAELCRQRIAELEEQVRAGKDRDAAAELLAYRLDRLAMFLAHCPDADVRDTKAAVKQATRATQLQPTMGDYWFTLALVQYRNGDWRDSLASLERIRAREGGFDASAWFLVAMDRQRLGQPEEARVALRRAHEWITELRRKAEGNAVLQFQYEMMRPSLDALRQEAEGLIDGGDAGGSATG